LSTVSFTDGLKASPVNWKSAVAQGFRVSIPSKTRRANSKNAPCTLSFFEKAGTPLRPAKAAFPGTAFWPIFFNYLSP
jgi:hypothetical protein